MSNPGISKLQMLVITGNPVIDAVIRYGLLFVFATITGAIVGWLNAHGFHDPKLLTIYVPTAVGTILGSLALAFWGVIRTSKNEAIAKLREAIGFQAGVNAAESSAPTPQVTVANAQTLIAEHATPIAKS